MSHIFDALQRSDFEQSGSENAPPSIATELLEAAERKAGFRVVAAEPEMQPLPVVAPEMPLPADLPAPDTGVNQFTQFQSLRVLVPPQSRLVVLNEQESLAAEKFRFLSVRLR